MINLKEQIAP